MIVLMNSRIILFDLDHTLFNTPLFKSIIDEQMQIVLGLSGDEFVEFQQQYLNKLEYAHDFDPSEYAAFLAAGDEVREKQLSDVIFNNEQLYRESVFPNAREVLESLAQGYELGIFSQGAVEFQKTKLHHSGLVEYFNPDHIYIAAHKTTDEFLKIIPDDCIIIDDDPNVIAKLVGMKKCLPIWLNRYERDLDLKVDSIAKLSDLRNKLEELNSRTK